MVGFLAKNVDKVIARVNAVAIWRFTPWLACREDERWRLPSRRAVLCLRESVGKAPLDCLSESLGLGAVVVSVRAKPTALLALRVRPSLTLDHSSTRLTSLGNSSVS